MNSIRSMLVPILLLTGGVGLIQYHSIAFWAENVSQDVGWAWSVVIEVAGLWLWYRPDAGSRVLGLLASLLLLAGPLYLVSAPALEAMSSAEAVAAANQEQIELLRKQIAQDAQLIETYAHNSQKRTGWLPAIQEVQQRVDQGRSRMAELQAKKAEAIARAGYKGYALVLLQALGLVLLQITNVLVITYISRMRRAGAKDAQPEDQVEGGEVDEYRQLRGLAARVRAFIEEEELSISRAAERLGVDRQNLSYLLGWSQPGDRKPASVALDHLNELFV